MWGFVNNMVILEAPWNFIILHRIYQNENGTVFNYFIYLMDKSPWHAKYFSKHLNSIVYIKVLCYCHSTSDIFCNSYISGTYEQVLKTDLFLYFQNCLRIFRHLVNIYISCLYIVFIYRAVSCVITTAHGDCF